MTASSSSHDTTQDSRDSLEGDHTSKKAEGRLNLEELFVLCTNLSNRVLALETSKEAQAAEILKLKDQIKKLKRKRKNAKPEPTLDVFDDLDADGRDYMKTKDVVKEGRQSNETEELNKGSSEKGGSKSILEEPKPAKKMTRSDFDAAQIARDAEIARQLQVDLQAEVERERQREEEASKAAIAETYDEVQAGIDADALFAAKLQPEEREEYTIEERAKFLAETIAAQRKFRAAQRSAEIRSRPPTKSQLRNLMMTVIDDFKPMDSDDAVKDYKEAADVHKQKVLEEPNSTKVEVKQEGHEESIRKRPGRRLKMKATKKSKRQKTDADLEEEEQLKAYLKIVPDEEGIIDQFAELLQLLKALQPPTIHQISVAKTYNLNEKVKTTRVNNVTTAGPKAGNPQYTLQDQGIFDSGCSRHMTGNKSFLTDYQEVDGGFVAFAGSPKGGKITRKGKIRTGKLDFEDVYFVKELKFNLFSVSQMCDKKNSVLFTETECLVLSPDFKLLDESQVLLKVPRQNNMYSFDLKCDNGTAFKNNDMNQFCGLKGIKREFSVARTPQQNGVAERKNRTLIEAARTMLKNRTLIEAARTMLTDSLLPTILWAEAVNTTCYVQNRVLVTKPHNKTPYELLLGRPPSISFMRHFRYPVTILNTLDPLGKFDGKANKGFFVGYSINSKAFRVFNTRTRKVEENLHINFLEKKPNVAGRQARQEKASDHEYILLPLMLSNSPLSSSSQSTYNKDADEVLGKGDDDLSERNGQEKKEGASNKEDDQHVQDFRTELNNLLVQQKEGYANNTNRVSTVNPCVSAAGQGFDNADDQERIDSSTQDVNTAGPSINTASENINTGSSNINTVSPIPNDPSMQSLEATGIFDDAYDDREEVGAEADLNNLKECGSTLTHLISLLDYDAFYFDDDHIEEKGSGSTTTHFDFSLPEHDSFIFDLSIDPSPPVDKSDFYHEEFADELAHIISPSEYDHFYFDIEDDPIELTRLFKENISETSPKDLTRHELNDLRLLLSDCDSIFSEIEFPGIDLLVLFPSENEDKVFDPGILIIDEVFSEVVRFDPFLFLTQSVSMTRVM
ncbi:ribonuclease H-like domain-containing protein [Tanacetum coccineum]|uniref:Ribonuclease H-like domain-containing protein n=1 Tax=Tanacetum coccineum TaxID=301880 RepID=A0ABQ5J0P4_9ASTR